MKVIPGTVQICSNILKENNLLAISPGGVYEAQFGNSYYTLMWRKRLGFAKVALDAKVVSSYKGVLKKSAAGTGEEIPVHSCSKSWSSLLQIFRSVCKNTEYI
jgi:hypothetical protein